MFVPVVDLDNKPLMPTSPARARRWVKSGKATPFWKRGIWCVRLNSEPSARNVEELVLAIDPGSKREGFTVKGSLHTYLNIQAHAVDWVKYKVEARRNARKARRNRKTPCRQPRWANRLKNKARLTPSTKARWKLKLRVLSWLARMFPIATVAVEDIEAKAKRGAKRWNTSFSPLQVGKEWFYAQIRERFTLVKYKGWESAEIRKTYGLIKIKDKLSEEFEAHCVDSWAMANDYIGGHTKPDNTQVVVVKPLKLARRQLHVFNAVKGGVRKLYGSTISMGFVRGSIVTHPKYGECLVGGTSKGRISLHCRRTNKRLCRIAWPKDIRFRCFNSFLIRVAI